MRIVFCFVPAAIPATLFWIFHPLLAVFSFTVAFVVGWSVTAPRPDRGEVDQ